MSGFTAVQKKAMDIIARRGHFSEELRLKLLARGFEENQIDTVIDQFRRRGYLNDEERAAFFIEELQNKRYGKYQIIQRLQQRGLGRDLTERLVREKLDSSRELENIKYLLGARRFDLASGEGSRKAAVFLERRGFSTDVIMDVIREAKTACET